MSELSGEEALQFSEVGCSKTSDGIPAFDGAETLRAAARICAVRYVVEHTLEARRVYLDSVA